MLKRILTIGELAGEVTRELQVVGKAASIAIQTWVRNNDKTEARAEEREKNNRGGSRGG